MRTRTKITKRSVDALQAPDAGEVTIWDSEIKGFGLRCRVGGEKTYIYMYRFGGKLRKLTIGKHGALTPDQARAKAYEAQGKVNEAGIDPAGVKRAAREAETVADLAKKFLEEHVDTKRKASTANEYRRLLDKLILPQLGDIKVKDVARDDVGKLHHDLRGKKYQANRVLALLSAMFNKAEAWGMRPNHSNPCKHIERHGEDARERMLSSDELARLGAAVTAYRSAYVQGAVKLLLFTGARLNEILTLKWDQVDFERGEARLFDSKTGKKSIQLPPPALAVLAGLPRIVGNPFVICGHKHGTHLVNLEKPWRAIRAEAGLDDVRLHDLRHAFASVGASSGEGLHMIGKLLGHTQQATTARYAHLASDPLKAAAAGIAGKIEAALIGQTAEVIPLKRA
jgi:integrase